MVNALPAASTNTKYPTNPHLIKVNFLFNNKHHLNSKFHKLLYISGQIDAFSVLIT